MNSVEEISVYKREYIDPTFINNSVKTAATTYDFPEHPPKKEKKWSFGNLFRRKKKDDSESSSEEDTQKSFLNGGSKKKRKTLRRKKGAKPIRGAFDHIVLPPQQQPKQSNGYYMQEDTGVLSDPSGGFNSYTGRPLPKLPISSPADIKQINKQGLVRSDSHNSHNSLGSTESRRSRRERTKARAVARRDSMKQGSSSDEDSQRSYSSSRFRSDESLSKCRDGHKKSRNARTERYIRRLSKDDESILNREAMQRQARENWYLNIPADYMNYKSPTRSPNLHTTPKSSTESFINGSSLSQPNFSGLFTIPPSHSNHNVYRATILNNNKSQYDKNVSNNCIDINSQTSHCFNLRSLSCDANIHKSPSPENDVMHVQLPLKNVYAHGRNVSLVEQPLVKHPPPPPPRDPKRLFPMNDNRPLSHYYDKTNQLNGNRSIRNSYRPNQWYCGYRTASEDHIPTEPRQVLAPRPSSVTNDTRQQKLISQQPERFQYLTEKKPRSRKPIFIQSTDKINSINYNQSVEKPNESNWVKQSENGVEKPSQMFTAHTHVQTKVFLPSVVNLEADNDVVDFPLREPSPFKPISSPISSGSTPKPDRDGSADSLSNELSQEVKRKSANLEDALDELEAIYKSLHLGDEDLLERAEQREMSIATKKLIDSKSESYPSWGISRGAMSDSSFTYEPFDSVDSPKKKRILKKAHTLDRKNDDMAYRKLNKDRSTPTNNTLANVSYLLASPVHGPQDEIDGFTQNENDTDEPDVTLDDVVYRNIKHANNSLRVVDPQPPFGIPIGPITPAPNSDYLHAVPENSIRFTFKRKKIPDIVKDDLAYRNLRKDPNKEPALKPSSPEDLENLIKDGNQKKKRAVRSLSANISNIMQKDKAAHRKGDMENEFNSTTLSDIADAMEIARQILKEKENRISATRRAFLSDSDTKLRKSALPSTSSNETITESRLNFLNEMRSSDKENHNSTNLLFKDVTVDVKPLNVSEGRSIHQNEMNKRTTPENSIKRDSLNSSFEELLTALAVEARETSDRITNELKNLDSSLNRNKSINKHDNKNLEEKLSEIDAVSEHAKLCEKLFECVVESTELIASSKTETTPIEQVEQIDDALIPESVANIITTRIENEPNPVNVEVHSISEPDYENLNSDNDFEKDISLLLQENDGAVTCKSPFEENKAELVASFRELERLNDHNENCGGEECDLEVVALPIDKECAFKTESKISFSDDGLTTYTTNCDIFITDDYTNTDCEQGEYQPSSGFHSNSSCTDSVTSDQVIDGIDHMHHIPAEPLETLKSPQLVTSAMKQTCNNNTSNISKPPSLSSAENVNIHRNDNDNNHRPSVSGYSSHDSGHTLDKTRSWYGDPLVLAFACSYGVACSYQLASLDVVAVLGLLFVIISIAAVLFLE